eukprot:gene11115-23227_t
MQTLQVFALLFTIGQFLVVQSSKTGDTKEVTSNAKPIIRDIKYIECDICENTMLHIQTKTSFITVPEGTYLSETAIGKLIDDVCEKDDPKSWVRRIDITKVQREDGSDILHLAKQSSYSHCGVECMTIHAGCKKFVEEQLDYERLVSTIHKFRTTNATMKDLPTEVCTVWTKLCPSKHKVPISYQREDFEFKGLSSDEVHSLAEARHKRMENTASSEGEGVMALFDLADDMTGVRAYLYYEQDFRGELSVSAPIRHNTYLGHKWFVKVNNQIVKSWVITAEPTQIYSLSWNDIKRNKKDKKDL